MFDIQLCYECGTSLYYARLEANVVVSDWSDLVFDDRMF